MSSNVGPCSNLYQVWHPCGTFDTQPNLFMFAAASKGVWMAERDHRHNLCNAPPTADYLINQVCNKAVSALHVKI